MNSSEPRPGAVPSGLGTRWLALFACLTLGWLGLQASSYWLDVPLDVSTTRRLSLVAAVVCGGSFGFAALADNLGRAWGQSVAGPLTAIGFRSGGVAFAAVLVNVWLSQAESRWFLLSLVTLFGIALAVDTTLWVRGLQRSSGAASRNPEP